MHPLQPLASPPSSSHVPLRLKPPPTPTAPRPRNWGCWFWRAAPRRSWSASVRGSEGSRGLRGGWACAFPAGLQARQQANTGQCSPPQSCGTRRRPLGIGKGVVPLTLGPSSLPALAQHPLLRTTLSHPTEAIFLYHSADSAGHLHLCRRLLPCPGGQA